MRCSPIGRPWGEVFLLELPKTMMVKVGFGHFKMSSSCLGLFRHDADKADDHWHDLCSTLGNVTIGHNISDIFVTAPGDGVTSKQVQLKSL